MTAVDRLMSAIDSDYEHREAHAEYVAQVVANALLKAQARRHFSDRSTATGSNTEESSE